MRLRFALHFSFGAILSVMLIVLSAAIFHVNASLHDLRVVVNQYVPFLKLVSESYNAFNDSIVIYDDFKHSEYVTFEKVSIYVKKLDRSIVKIKRKDTAAKVDWTEANKYRHELNNIIPTGAVYSQDEKVLSSAQIANLEENIGYIVFNLQRSLQESLYLLSESYPGVEFDRSSTNLFNLLFATSKVIKKYYGQKFSLTTKILNHLAISERNLRELLDLYSASIFGSEAKQSLNAGISFINRYQAAVILFDDEQKLGVSGASFDEIAASVTVAQFEAKQNLQNLIESTLGNITFTQQQIIAANMKQRNLFILAAIAAIILVAINLTVLNRVISSNINMVVRGAEYFAQGDLKYRIFVGHKKEYLTRLAIALNKMADTLHNRDIEKSIYLERLNKAERMEAIGLMAGGVAHDLNNILSGIVSYPEILLQKIPPESELRKPLTAIQKAGIRAADIVSDLLSYARSAGITKKIKSINILVEEYISSPEHEKLLESFPLIIFQLQLLTNTTFINCSESHVKKTIMNIIFNAFEAIDENQRGVCSLETQNISIKKDQAEELGIVPGNYIVLRIRDNGSGIPQSDIPHIFEPFYTTKKMGRSGTGLGLAIVYNSMQEHQGTITVESSKEGTCFELYYPTVDRPGNSGAKTLNVDELKSKKNERLLIVDDEESLRDIASRILMNLNYEVSAVSSGEDALLYLNSHEVDLIILDMHMGTGINGLKTYQQIIEINPNQKAIIVSGFAESELVQQAFNCGITEFVNKPYSSARLGTAIKNELHKSV